MRDHGLENRVQGALDVGSSVWVVGDIHGYRETFECLLGSLCLSGGDLVVCLGDLIDRGPDSLGVMRIVRDREEVLSIRGNHDEMLRLSLSSRHGGRMMRSWLKYGGLDTLSSMSDQQERSLEVAESWVDFVESLPTQLVLRDFRLAHAGFVEGTPIDEQSNQDLMWSRGVFEFQSPPDTERQVIVGHTTTQALMGAGSEGIWESPVRLKGGRPAVIGIDTGIYLPRDENPRLTAINLADGSIVSVNRIEESQVDISP